MRLSLLIPGFGLLAACATAPQPMQPPLRPPLQPPPSQNMRGAVIGLTTEELVLRLGTPALQIREGNSLKLQFRSQYCVLDAYLYPPVGAGAPYRVTYVDTRSRALANVDQAACMSSLQGA